MLEQLIITQNKGKKGYSVKYEKPDIKIVLSNNIYTTFGLGNSDSEGGIEKGFPLEEGLST